MQRSVYQESQAGLAIPRYFTREGEDVYNSTTYDLRNSIIKNPDGSTVFKIEDVEVPTFWSQVATDILAQKYLRKKGVPLYTKDGQPLLDEFGNRVTGAEHSIKQVAHRLAGCWRHWGEKYGYFKTQQDAETFYDELAYMLIHQIAAPNSPQWFNTGLAWAYGIKGIPQGHYYVDPDTKQLTRSTDAYTHGQVHACFIQSISDDLVNDGGIMDLWTREARIFKYGSGTGTNFSSLRGAGETLSGGGKSSGLMSFLKIGDAAAGAIKSGGTTRRAAKMCCLDLDHPEIIQFIDWKMNEEKKVAALMKAGYEGGFEGEAYLTVSGQNSNNSIRIPHEFMKTLRNDGTWNLTWRTDGRICKTFKASYLWDKIGTAAWHCADPGVQYDGTINDWHTCPQSGKIKASNPCSEFMFLDDTACNLASINLIKFLDNETKTFDVEGFQHAVRIWTTVLEISILMAQFPSKAIAELSYEFRTLGLGYANIGAMLMQMGIPYDSDEARAVCSSITAIMTGQSYATSAELAKHLGPFSGYTKNRDDMLRIIRNHRRATYNTPASEYENLTIPPQAIQEQHAPAYLIQAARATWDEALEEGERWGYRNAQVTVLAPTGTIGLVMDCDTTGVEPDFALVKFKKLAGGGYFKIVNQSVEPALQRLGYTTEQIKDIITYLVGTNTLTNAPHIHPAALKAKGCNDEDLAKIQKTLPTVFDISNAFTHWTLGEDTMQRLSIDEKSYNTPGFNLLKHLGFTSQQIIDANNTLCGTMTIEGAPQLKDEHLPVFDCANKCGKNGKRFIHHLGHIKIMAAAQPFISGAISKTINMPNEATIDDIKDAYAQSYYLGLKAVALYRDGSKLSQALSTAEEGKQEEKTATPAAPIIAPSSSPRKLPTRRTGITVESTLGGQPLRISTGDYEDGSLGDIAITFQKEGTTFNALMNCFAKAVSIGLQHGAPLKTYVDTFTFTRFEPNGMTSHPNVRTATSVVDFIFRVIGMEYLGRTDFVHVKPTSSLQKEARADIPTPARALSTPQQKVSATEAALQDLMGDAPPCATCGHTTIRSGACYKCLNCGDSAGCS